jgi:hypothetical protein
MFSLKGTSNESVEDDLIEFIRHRQRGAQKNGALGSKPDHGDVCTCGSKDVPWDDSNERLWGIWHKPTGGFVKDKSGDARWFVTKEYAQWWIENWIVPYNPTYVKGDCEARELPK